MRAPDAVSLVVASSHAFRNVLAPLLYLTPLWLIQRGGVGSAERRVALQSQRHQVCLSPDQQWWGHWGCYCGLIRSPCSFILRTRWTRALHSCIRRLWTEWGSLGKMVNKFDDMTKKLGGKIEQVEAELKSEVRAAKADIMNKLTEMQQHACICICSWPRRWVHPRHSTLVWPVNCR